MVGNVPFANIHIQHRDYRFALHDYFLAKSADALAAGGVLALVTTHYTLDKQNAAVREYLAERADFLGAVRLPSDAFRREGTAVVTDILFLRNRSPDEPASHVDPAWRETAAVEVEGASVTISRYFLDHPEMVLGTFTRKDTLYGGEGYGVESHGDLEQLLRTAVDRLPKLPRRTSCSAAVLEERFVPPPPERHVTEGSFFAHEGRIHQMVDGTARPVAYGGSELWVNGGLVGRRLWKLIDLRDKARRVLQSQNEGWPEEHRVAARRDLNWAYGVFVQTYGPINKTTTSEGKDGAVVRRMPNLVKFREDPDAMLVMALEEYDEESGTAGKAPILLRDVVGKSNPVTSVASAEEGLLVSLDRKGGVDLPYIAGLYGKDAEAVVSELGNLVYRDPASDLWQTADQYLSGNVRAKLKVTLAAGVERNIEALQAVQPADVLPGDIDANIGAPWVPTSDIQAFAADLFGVPPAAISVSRLEKDAVWTLDGDYRAEQSVAARADYGTGRVNGLRLLDLALNQRFRVVYDPDPSDPEKRVVNQSDTLAAKEKQRAIKERFKAWVFADPDRTERLVRLYNDAFNNLRPRRFDGTHLAFPGMSRDRELRPHQKDAVWRVVSGGNTLLAHVVGAGKTAVMCAAAMKLRQTGLAHKPLVVVPNHLLEQFAREFQQWYPNAKLLIAGKDDLARDRRKYLTAKIASGDWDAVVVTHSSFERLGMSKEFRESFLRGQLEEYDRLLTDKAAMSASGRNVIKTIEKQKAQFEAKLKELAAEDRKDDGLVFDELGVDYVFYDEAAAVKNLSTPTKMDRVAGIQTGGSERAFDMLMKAHFLDRLNPGRGVTFANGTPVSNSMVELYTMQRFLDPAGLTARGIEHFDAWAATFGEVVEAMEIAPDGKSLRPRARFAKFVNLPELQQMFRSFADVQTAEMLNLPRPTLKDGKPRVVACPMSDTQKELQDALVARYERIRSEKVDPREDNALAITTDGRKLALDARMLTPAEDFPGSKVNALVGNVFAVWERTAASRGTQIIFSDFGVHPTPWGFSAYDDITRKLVAAGIPPEQVVCVGEADSDVKKQALFEKVRGGAVRVLLGSTAKLGTGSNVQRRLIALHHLDAPWKPAEVEQRDGRILRQGNRNPEVEIYRYVTEGSFDAYMWQALEAKARFIAQVMTGESGVRRAEDVGDQTLSFAEVKAIASGNPAVLVLAEADAELQRLGVLRRSHADGQYLARRNVQELPEVIARLEEQLAGLEADAGTVAHGNPGAVTIDGRTWDVKDSLEALGSRLDRLPADVPRTRSFPLGEYRGLGFGLDRHPGGTTDVYLKGRWVRTEMLTRESRGPRAVLNAARRIAETYGERCEKARRDLEVNRGQLRDYRVRLGAPFAHEAHLADLTRRRDELKLALSDRNTEAGGTDSAALAERVKALMAAHRVEPVLAGPPPAAAPVAAVEPVCHAEPPECDASRRYPGSATLF